jgi:hypothetical protein
VSKVPELTDEERSVLRQALLAFGRAYLQALPSQGAPMRSLGLGAWRSHPTAPEHFFPLETRPPPDTEQWKEYQAVEAHFLSHPKLARLLTEPMNSSGDPAPDFRGLLAGIVAMPIERYEARHGAVEDGLAELIEQSLDWFCRDDDPMFVATSLVGFTASGPLTLSPGITVRRATDEEVSVMLRMGALNVDSPLSDTFVGIKHIPEALRWVVTLDHSRPRRFGETSRPEDEPDLIRLKEAVDAFVAALRIFTPAAVRRGPTLSVHLNVGRLGGGSADGFGPPAMFAWHQPARILASDMPAFIALTQAVLNGRVKLLKIAHGLHRFSEANIRTNPADQVVDLVTALESMFSENHESLGYKVSRRASALLGHLGLPAATVSKFVSNAYASRSDIVHGEPPTHKNLAGKSCEPEEQARQLDRLVAAIFRRVLTSSSSRKVHEYADEVINAALDAARVPAAATSDPPTYSVTVTHDGKVFIGTPAEYQTAWTRGATVAELRARLGEILALWTQAPCSADQIKFERDKAARAADPSDGAVETAAIP